MRCSGLVLLRAVTPLSAAARRGAAVRLGILGPLLIVDDAGDQIAVAAARQRTLLAALLVRANRIVPVDELVEIVWDRTPPPGAARTLRSYVVRLRQALGPGVAARIRTQDPGYLCRVADDELDVLRFEALCRDGGASLQARSWERASAELTEALALWRGTPLVDVASPLLIRQCVPRLEQARLQAREWRIEADLCLGGHDRLVPELNALVEADPLREHSHAQLMVALYRCGRRAEALDAFGRARRILVDELAEDLGEGRGAALTRLFDHYLYASAAAMDVAFSAERHRRPRLSAPEVPSQVPVDEAAALDWLTAELPNLVAVVEYAAGHGWPGHAIRLSATLFRYLDTAARFPEAQTVHGHARRAASGTGDRAAEAGALVALGLIDGHQGRHRQATSRLELALSLYRTVGDQDGQARALNYLGLVDRQQGRYERATEQLTLALGLFRAVAERTGEGHVLSNLGAIDLEQGRYREAVEHQRQALALFGEIGDRQAEALVFTRSALVALRQDRYPEAAGELRQALARYRAVGDRQGEASALASLGRVDLQRRHYPNAARQLQQALRCYREIGDPSGQAGTLNSLGDLLLATERPADARTRYAAALRLAAQIGAKYEQARAHDGLANAHHAAGTPAKARHHWLQALALYTDLGAPDMNQVRARLAVDDQPVPDVISGSPGVDR